MRSRSSLSSISPKSRHAPSSRPSQVSPVPGTSKMAGVYTARIPASSSPRATASGWRYCSVVVVMPLPSNSAAPSIIPQ